MYYVTTTLNAYRNTICTVKLLMRLAHFTLYINICAIKAIVNTLLYIIMRQFIITFCNPNKRARKSVVIDYDTYLFFYRLSASRFRAALTFNFEHVIHVRRRLIQYIGEMSCNFQPRHARFLCYSNAPRGKTTAIRIYTRTRCTARPSSDGADRWVPRRAEITTTR